MSLSCLFFVLAGTAAGATLKRKPNLVFVLADDLGWNGVGYHNHDVHTPTIDDLATNGLQLDSFYTYRVCAPARASFLTGRFPFKLAATRTNFAYFQTLEGTDLGYTFFPQKLKELGYATHMVGKWHQGFYAPQYLPTSRGFDTYFGFLSGCEDHVNQENCCAPCNKTKYGIGKPIDLFANDKPAIGKNGTHTGFLFTQAAVDIIHAHGGERKGLGHDQDEKPLFLYLALHNTHAPFQVPSQYSEKYKYEQSLRNVWSGMVSMVDETLHNVTTALKQAQLWDNTLLIMAGDNGSPVCGWGAAGSNAPLRGGKASNWEGGVKTFAFAAGGALPQAMKGKSLDGMVHISDFYRTYLALAGAPNASDPGGPSPLDSTDISDYLFGVAGSSPRAEIVHDHFNPHNPTGAIRVGDWKLLVGVQHMATWFGEFSPNTTSPRNASATSACANQPCLFNIREDPTEHEDLADKRPDKVAELLKRFHAHDTDLHPPGPKGSDEDGYCAAAAANSGFMVPWRTHPVSDQEQDDLSLSDLPNDPLSLLGEPWSDSTTYGAEVPAYVI